MEKQKVISFEREEGHDYITVGEMKKHLEKFDDELVIIMSRDEEGNGYLPLYSGNITMYLLANGEILSDTEDAKYYGCEYKPNALVLYP